MATTTKSTRSKQTTRKTNAERPDSTKLSRAETATPRAQLIRDRPTPLNLSAKTLWPKTTELLSLEFTLRPLADCQLYAQYTIGLHAWFLHQIQDLNPDLSAYLHDGESEKPFSLTGLSGKFIPHSQSLRLRATETYRWRINILSKQVIPTIAAWLRQLPNTLDLKNAPLTIESVHLAQPASTYAKLLRQGKALAETTNSVSLSFISPTSFRRKGHHLPLPWPTNVFHSYLRRWNHFARKQVEQTDFLDWIDCHVIIQQHQMASAKVAAGKKGSVTGFTGAITYALDRKAADYPFFVIIFHTLSQLAPYCGTGHKTTFGLGETYLGWQIEGLSGKGEQRGETPMPIAQMALAERIGELSALFLSQKKRQGGDRARNTADTWATILARREAGDSLGAIAQDMNLPYETTKTYAKLARRALRQSD